MKKILLEIFGWYGTLAIMLAYVLVSFSILSSSSIWYQLLNVTGSVGLLTISFYKKTFQPAILNAIWVIIGTIAIINIIN